MPKQIGWVDEFGNVFPMGAWKPQQKNYLDSHKVIWEPVYTLSESELGLMNVQSIISERDRLRKTWQKENDEIVQVLGKALQYPKYVDDQSVFPGATEADGVCVPCHTALSIADEAAARIEALRAAARDVCEWADAAQWALGNETGVPAAKLDALRDALEGK